MGEMKMEVKQVRALKRGNAAGRTEQPGLFLLS